MSTKKKTDPKAEAASRLAALQHRRAELEAELPAQLAALEAAQSDLIDGKAGAEQAANDAQARITSTEGALGLLRTKIAGAEAELETIEAAEVLERYKRELVEAARAGKDAADRDAAAHQRLREAFEAFVSEVAAARSAWSHARGRFDQLYAAAEAAGEAPGRLHELLWQEDLSPRMFAGGFPQEYDLGEYRGQLVQARTGALNKTRAAT